MKNHLITSGIVAGIAGYLALCYFNPVFILVPLFAGLGFVVYCVVFDMVRDIRGRD